MSVDKEQVKRVTNEKASKLFTEGWRYVSKSVWKEKVRDVEKKSVVDKDTGKTEIVSKHSNEMSKAQKRHIKTKGKS